MPDLQTLVASARSFLSSADQTMTEELRTLATEFADACRVTELRLRRCEDYLRRGLRAEAVHQAELDPPVLEMVQALDFPGRPQWDELVSMYGLPTGPRVNLQRAAALNQAYADHQAIEPQLKKLRNLALARAPLSDRHLVLRELAQIDRNTTFWVDDLKECEQALMKEMIASGREAIKRGDGGSLAAIIMQLESTGWMMPPLPTVLAELRAGHAKFAAVASRNQLPAIARELNRAAKAQDYMAAVAIRQRLEAEMHRAQVPPSDPIFLQVQPALEWIAEQEQDQREQAEFSAACEQFAQLLESPKLTSEQLRAGWQALEAHQRPIPAELKKGYRSLKEELQEDVREKARFWGDLFRGGVLLLIAPVLAALLVLGYLIYRLVNK